MAKSNEWQRKDDQKESSIRQIEGKEEEQDAPGTKQYKEYEGKRSSGRRLAR